MCQLATINGNVIAQMITAETYSFQCKIRNSRLIFSPMGFIFIAKVDIDYEYELNFRTLNYQLSG